MKYLLPQIALALMGTGISYVVYYYRWDIMFWWVVKRRYRLSRRNRISSNRKYHAFLPSTCSDWELEAQIFSELEEGPDVQFKIAFEHRDFIPGVTIDDNINRCIDESEKVICLINRRCLESERFELHLAHMRYLAEERRNMFIFVFVERFKPNEMPIHIRALSRSATCLQYPDPGNAREVQNFWYKLKLSLAQNSGVGTRPSTREDYAADDILIVEEHDECSTNHLPYDQSEIQEYYNQMLEQSKTDGDGDSDDDDFLVIETIDYLDLCITTDDEEQDEDNNELLQYASKAVQTLPGYNLFIPCSLTEYRNTERGKRSNVPLGKRYHAFLSYANPDWRLAYHIFQELENGDDVQFLTAYDCRDFVPGITIGENIARCIDQSEKVIFLITRQFLNRAWTTFELNYAQMRSFDEVRNLIILVFLEEFDSHELSPRIRALCQQVNYLHYPDSEDSRSVGYFWYRLKMALATDSGIGTDSTKYPPRREEIADISYDEEQDITDHNKLKAGLSTQQVNDCDAVSRTSSEGAWDQRQNIRIPGFRIQNVVWVRTLETAIGKHRFRRGGRQGRRWRRLRDQ